MAQTLTDAQYDSLADRFIRGEAASVAVLARENDIAEECLQQYARDHSWHKLHAEYREAKLRKPINDLLPAPARVNGNGHQLVHIDLAAPTLAYHAAIESVQRLIARASADAEAAGDEEAKDKAERRLDRLLERQRIMLRIPSPGRDNNAARQLPVEPTATEV